VGVLYYEADGITLYKGRWEDVLPTLPAGSVDLVFTSPPYNLGNTTGGRSTVRRKTTAMQHGAAPAGHYPESAGLGKRGGAGKWGGGDLVRGYGSHDDAMPHARYVRWQKRTLSALWPLLSRTGAIFYNHKQRVLSGRLVSPFEYVPTSLRAAVRQVVIWKRAGGVNFNPAFYMPTHEWIVVIARPAFRLSSRGASGAGDVWEVVQETNNKHPAPFPVGLPLRAIETTPARTILDPYCGSGTTLLAAKMAGRRAIGIELEERYCRMAVERLRQSVLPLGA
jgi:site-specific DNA-methyltransferase (adenine-specific)